MFSYVFVLVFNHQTSVCHIRSTFWIIYLVATAAASQWANLAWHILVQRAERALIKVVAIATQQSISDLFLSSSLSSSSVCRFEMTPIILGLCALCALTHISINVIHFSRCPIAASVPSVGRFFIYYIFLINDTFLFIFVCRWIQLNYWRTKRRQFFGIFKVLASEIVHRTAHNK